MSDLFAEFGTYLIKYVVFLVLAVAGFIAGTKWRKVKDSKEQKEEEKQ
ncbi:MAG: hypothetical protein IKQ49_05605 [Eubacterium sp.]|nr:hypothetical protein [Eubacterium sp.]MBR6172630.1 hypothetical protein [Eubacterium sp.]